jgi:transcriptional regulator with XRE-family HTH domain
MMSTNTINLDSYASQRRPEVGQCIREIRTSRGWTQDQVAHHLGCSRRRVNRVEQGITDFGVFELELLARAFEVPITCFLKQGCA